MKTVALEDATLDLCVAEAQQEQVILTRNGHPIVLVMSVDGMDEEQIRLCGSNEFWTLMEKRSRERTISRAELEQAGAEALISPRCQSLTPPHLGGTAVKTVIWTDNASWSEALHQAGEEDVLVLRDGRPVVLMTPFDDDDLAWYAREHDPAFLASLARARHQVGQGDTVSHGRLNEELGLD